MTTDVELYEPAQPPATLFGTDDPVAVVARASAAAKPLADVVNAQRLYALIGGKKYVLVEGYCLLGSMLGVFPVTVWTRKTETGWEARVEARTKHGEVVGAAEASCDRDERNWKSRDDFALRSMAQTRATSKALRQPLGFVMTLAGYAATPAEEMPRRSTTEEMYVEDAELVTDPDGNVFPDQRPVGSRFSAPVDAPAERDPNLASDAQLKNIGRLMSKLEKADDNITRESLKAEVQLAYGVSSSKELTKEEASEVIAGFMLRAGEEQK
jgi:hypothetical protein